MTIDKIRAAMTDRNLAEMGRRLNITRSYLHAVRSGKTTPSQQMTERLSEYLSK